MIRRILRCAMSALAVVSDICNDIEVALSEACTNVIKHSGPGDEFSVSLDLEPEYCTIRVIDTGHGFDWESLDDQSDLSAERGRGVELMRALVDRVKFESKPETGTIVHLEKALDLTESSVVHRMR